MTSYCCCCSGRHPLQNGISGDVPAGLEGSHQDGPPEAVESEHRQHERRYHGQHQRCRRVRLSCANVNESRPSNWLISNDLTAQVPSLTKHRVAVAGPSRRLPMHDDAGSLRGVIMPSDLRHNSQYKPNPSPNPNPTNLRQRRARELSGRGHDAFEEAVSGVEQHGEHASRPDPERPLPPRRPAGQTQYVHRPGKDLVLVTHDKYQHTV